jgi:L-alanine-DL-glutamate epimerase-like enolase superfamily enzyme
MLTEPFQIDKDGYIKVPQKPGLGVELDFARIKSCGVEV